MSEESRLYKVDETDLLFSENPTKTYNRYSLPEALKKRFPRFKEAAESATVKEIKNGANGIMNSLFTANPKRARRVAGIDSKSGYVEYGHPLSETQEELEPSSEEGETTAPEFEVPPGHVLKRVIVWEYEKK